MKNLLLITVFCISFASTASAQVNVYQVTTIKQEPKVAQQPKAKVDLKPMPVYQEPKVAHQPEPKVDLKPMPVYHEPKVAQQPKVKITPMPIKQEPKVVHQPN